MALSIALALGGAACSSDDGDGNTSGGGSSGATSGGAGASGPGPSSGSTGSQTTTGTVDPTTTSTGAVDPTTTSTGTVDPTTTSTGAVDPTTTSSTSTGMVEPKPCDASVAPDVGKLALEQVVTNVDKLTYAIQAPGSDDWYLVQQTGTIRVFTGGSVRSEPFLDVSSQIQLQNFGGGDDERGLLGLAFAPDYPTSGKFYIMMSPTSGDHASRDVVLEYTRSSGDPYKANPTPSKTILRLDQSAFNHNGGHVVFGPDGMLYVGTGDGGGSCGDNKPGAAQDVKALFGKILRLDPNAAEPYAASGNPFAADGDPRVLHYGVRNPYRFAFDRATGDLYIGDVGQNAYEEVDFAPAGAKGLNFGWPKWEGLHEDTCTRPTPQLRPGSTHTPPIVEMDRRMSSTGPYRDYVSVIGGPVYRGSALPQLQGVYLFGDYRGVRMGALVQCGDKTSPVTHILKNRDPNTPNTPAFTLASGLATFRDLTAIVEDHDGEIYFVANRNSLWKVVPGQ